jgi:hypothetical protein
VTSSVSGKRANPCANRPVPCLHEPSTCCPQARWRRDLNPCTRLCRPLPRLSATPPDKALDGAFRADDGIRTRDPHLGKVMRYQLRYVRMSTTRVNERER